jgi:hypothetical protein
MKGLYIFIQLEIKEHHLASEVQLTQPTQGIIDPYTGCSRLVLIFVFCTLFAPSFSFFRVFLETTTIMWAD